MLTGSFLGSFLLVEASTGSDVEPPPRSVGCLCHPGTCEIDDRRPLARLRWHVRRPICARSIASGVPALFSCLLPVAILRDSLKSRDGLLLLDLAIPQLLTLRDSRSTGKRRRMHPAGVTGKCGAYFVAGQR